MIDVRKMIVTQAQMGFQSGSFTARDLLSAYLKRIQNLDRSGPQINSTLALSPTVLDEADELDRHIATTGSLRGKLHGIPVLVKDQASQSLLAESPSLGKPLNERRCVGRHQRHRHDVRISSGQEQRPQCRRHRRPEAEGKRRAHPRQDHDGRMGHSVVQRQQCDRLHLHEEPI